MAHLKMSVHIAMCTAPAV